MLPQSDKDAARLKEAVADVRGWLDVKLRTEPRKIYRSVWFLASFRPAKCPANSPAARQTIAGPASILVVR